MIIHTGLRTDIPAFYSEWFYNRIREGYVLARNPYRQNQIYSYRLDPKVVDCICFCTKNPKPMLEKLDEISAFNQFWFVTITSYEKDIEKNVPHYSKVMESFRQLSDRLSPKQVSWRYDPVFISEKYSLEYHLEKFEEFCTGLGGYTEECVISFIDLYEKTKRNFPEAREVTVDEQLAIGKDFSRISKRHKIQLKTCAEGRLLQRFGVDCNGCMTREVFEKAIDNNLKVPKGKGKSRECDCILGSDIGFYNTCNHNCIYCYANSNMNLVKKNMKLHNPDSPLLIGNLRKTDEITEVNQTSYIDRHQKPIF